MHGLGRIGQIVFEQKGERRARLRLRAGRQLDPPAENFDTGEDEVDTTHALAELLRQRLQIRDVGIAEAALAVRIVEEQPVDSGTAAGVRAYDQTRAHAGRSISRLRRASRVPPSCR